VAQDEADAAIQLESLSSTIPSTRSQPQLGRSAASLELDQIERVDLEGQQNLSGADVTNESSDVVRPSRDSQLSLKAFLASELKKQKDKNGTIGQAI
jgi:hypothetical protein